jgi:hypothetical protein
MGMLSIIGRESNAIPEIDRRSAEQKQADDERATVWAFVWTLFGFKVATIAATLWAAAGSMEAAIVLLATNWFWFAFPMIAIWGPVLFRYRKWRVRRRREQMLRAEWMLE